MILWKKSFQLDIWIVFPHVVWFIKLVIFLFGLSVFSFFTAFPVSVVQSLPNVALLVTAHGGHIAFLQGLFPRGETFMERLFGQFFHAAFEHPRDLQRACGIQEEQEKSSYGEMKTWEN